VTKGKWQAVEVTTVLAAREAVEYGLMEAGALGTETLESEHHARVIGYFESAVDNGNISAALADSLRLYGLESDEPPAIKRYEIEDRDWLAEWKRNWQPVQAGRFVIAPPWIDLAALATNNEPIVIRIEPGMAFGTGTHETTRLCLKAIEKYFRGQSFLDVGSGTGVLAIAAAKMQPDARIAAYDIDPLAIDIAKENAQLNGVADSINFQPGSLTEETPSADFVCANLTAPVILELLPLLLAATCGRLVLSGILETQKELVESHLMKAGARILETEQDGEWVMLVI
jgi:ribosomal protein L11 methyltransferase